MSVLLAIPLALLLTGLAGGRWRAGRGRDARSIEAHKSTLGVIEHAAGAEPPSPEAVDPTSAHVRILPAPGASRPGRPAPSVHGGDRSADGDIRGPGRNGADGDEEDEVPAADLPTYPFYRHRPGRPSFPRLPDEEDQTPASLPPPRAGAGRPFPPSRPASAPVRTQAEEGVAATSKPQEPASGRPNGLNDPPSIARQLAETGRAERAGRRLRFRPASKGRKRSARSPRPSRPLATRLPSGSYPSGRRWADRPAAIVGLAGAIVLLAAAGVGYGVVASGRGSNHHPVHTATPAPPKASTPTTSPSTTVPTTTVIATNATSLDATYSVDATDVDLSLSTTAPCWAEIRDGSSQGPISFEGTLTAGASRTFTSGGTIWLRLGDPASAHLTVDGAPVSLPSAASPFNLTFVGLT